jgi:plasmid replication initiation protein
VLFMFGVYRIATRWIDRRHERLMAEGRAGGGSAELQQLRSRAEQLEDVVARVQDLEERLDFAERVLAQQRERGQLPAGGGRG